MCDTLVHRGLINNTCDTLDIRRLTVRKYGSLVHRGLIHETCHALDPRVSTCDTLEWRVLIHKICEC